jgi:hypothetical protein
LAEAGYPNGFAGGESTPFPAFKSMAEAIQGWLAAICIRSMSRAITARS